MPDHFKVEITTVAKFDLLAIVESLLRMTHSQKHLTF